MFILLSYFEPEIVFSVVEADDFQLAGGNCNEIQNINESDDPNTKYFFIQIINNHVDISVWNRRNISKPQELVLIVDWKTNSRADVM